MSGGSQTAASTGTAVQLAITKLRDQLAARRTSPDEPWAAVVSRSGQPELTAEHRTTERSATHSYLRVGGEEKRTGLGPPPPAE